MTLPVTLDEAVWGGTIATPTIGGTVNLTIPKGVSSGRVLRLRGRGLPSSDGKTKGDQLVEISIVCPPEIDEKLAGFIADWRQENAYDPRKGMKV